MLVVVLMVVLVVVAAAHGGCRCHSHVRWSSILTALLAATPATLCPARGALADSAEVAAEIMAAAAAYAQEHAGDKPSVPLAVVPVSAHSGQGLRVLNKWIDAALQGRTSIPRDATDDDVVASSPGSLAARGAASAPAAAAAGRRMSAGHESGDDSALHHASRSAGADDAVGAAEEQLPAAAEDEDAWLSELTDEELLQLEKD